MRIAALFLAATVSGFVPAIAHAVDTSAATFPSTGPAASSAETKTFSDADRTAIESIIKDYLTKEHPEIVMMAAQELEKRQQATAESKSEEAISKDKDKLYNDPNTPTAGDPKGEVTVVEFFDYQCGYCKMSEESVEKLLKDNRKVRFVYKDFPILGPESTVASKASFAAVRQGKFQAFHDALMTKKEHLTDDLIYQVAKTTGLDVDKLKKDMADPAIQKMIEDNLSLGGEIGVRGTPMFIINDKVYPGALQYDQLKQAVDTAAAAPKKS